MWDSLQTQLYSNNNPDVLQSYNQNSYGMPFTQYAQQHYQNYGQGEGRRSPTQIQSLLNRSNMPGMSGPPQTYAQNPLSRQQQIDMRAQAMVNRPRPNPTYRPPISQAQHLQNQALGLRASGPPRQWQPAGPQPMAFTHGDPTEAGNPRQMYDIPWMPIINNDGSIRQGEFQQTPDLAQYAQQYLADQYGSAYSPNGIQSNIPQGMGVNPPAIQQAWQAAASSPNFSGSVGGWDEGKVNQYAQMYGAAKRPGYQAPVAQNPRPNIMNWSLNRLGR